MSTCIKYLQNQCSNEYTPCSPVAVSVSPGIPVAVSLCAGCPTSPHHSHCPHLSTEKVQHQVKSGDDVWWCSCHHFCVWIFRFTYKPVRFCAGNGLSPDEYMLIYAVPPFPLTTKAAACGFMVHSWHKYFFFLLVPSFIKLKILALYRSSVTISGKVLVSGSLSPLRHTIPMPKHTKLYLPRTRPCWQRRLEIMIIISWWDMT